jgi:hypothetical protein
MQLTDQQPRVVWQGTTIKGQVCHLTWAHQPTLSQQLLVSSGLAQGRKQFCNIQTHHIS